MSSNWVRMTAVNNGSNIKLQDTVDGFIGVANRYTNDDRIYYILQEENNKEVGVGAYRQSDNTILRTQILETLVNGVFTELPTTGIPITSLGLFAIVPTAQGLTTHTPVWKQVTAQIQFDAHTGLLSPYMEDFLTRLGHSVKSWKFLPTLKEAIHFNLNIPMDIVDGGSLVPCLNWSPSTDGAGEVEWIMEITLSDPNSTTPEFADITSLSFNETTTEVALTNLLAEHLTTLDNMKVGMVLLGKLYRNGGEVGDTYIDPAFMHSISFKYLSDKVGTPSKDGSYYRWG